MLISQISPVNNYNKFQKVQSQQKNVVFGSLPVEAVGKSNSKFFKFAKDAFKPVKNVYGRFTTLLAKGLGKCIDNKYAMSLFEKTKNNDMFTHLFVLASTILSGFYIKRTLNNENLDPKKRKTLAINQGVVWGASTVMAYTIDKMINKKYKEFVSNFEKAYTEKYLKNEQAMKMLPTYKSGIGVLKGSVIVGIVFRYITPVLVTPIANAIGNKIHEKNEAKRTEVVIALK